MVRDRENQDDNLKDRVSDLLATIVSGGEEARTSACEALSRLLVSKHAVAAVLRQERAVGQDAVFVVSLRLDAARAAVRRAAVEFCAPAAPGRTDDAWRSRVDWFICRVDELSLGATDAARDALPGTVLDLFDAGHYRRGQRHHLEEQVISLFDEAGARPGDEDLRNNAFEGLWNWARCLAFSRCRDPHVADDVATETVLTLLRGARAIRTAEHAWSGMEVARRVRMAILGSSQATGGRWQGLLARVAMRRELSFTDVSITDEDVSRANDDPATRISQAVDDTPAATVGVSELPYRAMRDHLDLCRQQVRETTARQERGEQAQRALETVLDVLADRVVTAQRGDQDTTSFIVAELITHRTVERTQALPAFRRCWQIQRPRWITRRLLRIADQLLATGLLDRNLVPRAAHPDDLRSMLEDLEGRRKLPRFIRVRCQQQTLLEVVAFWRSSLEQLAAGLQVRQMAITLPPLFQSRRRLTVNSDILDAIAERLGISRNAAHNSIKRQLNLLTSWGMVDESTDMTGPD
jgi:hypothetical protein